MTSTTCLPAIMGPISKLWKTRLRNALSRKLKYTKTNIVKRKQSKMKRLRWRTNFFHTGWSYWDLPVFSRTYSTTNRWTQSRTEPLSLLHESYTSSYQAVNTSKEAGTVGEAFINTPQHPSTQGRSLRARARASGTSDWKRLNGRWLLDLPSHSQVATIRWWGGG